MKQAKQAPCHAPQKFAPQEEQQPLAPTNQELLDALDKATQTQEDDPLVWTCTTRLMMGGCARIYEGRPPVCPVYSLKKDPLFVCPIRVRLSDLKKRLTDKGGIKSGHRVMIQAYNELGKPLTSPAPLPHAHLGKPPEYDY